MYLNLYIITDKKIGLGGSHLKIIEKALDSGATIIQLRDKNKSSRELYEISKKAVILAKKFKALSILNDRLDIALVSNAESMHLGINDLPITVARKIAGKNFLIGSSVSITRQAMKAQEAGADYLNVQNIFNTTSKDNIFIVVISRLKEIKNISNISVIAIGGINEEHIGQVMNAGTGGVEVISAIIVKKLKKLPKH